MTIQQQFMSIANFTTQNLEPKGFNQNTNDFFLAENGDKNHEESEEAQQILNEQNLHRQNIKIVEDFKIEEIVENTVPNIEMQAGESAIQQGGQEQEKTFNFQKLVRFIYFVFLIYTGTIFPTICSFQIFLPALEICIDLLTLAYVIHKIRNKLQIKRQYYKEYFMSFSCFELISIIPFELWSDEFQNALYFLKIFRLVSLTSEFRYIFSDLIQSKQIEFWKMVMVLEIVMIWISNFWIFFSLTYQDPQNWVNYYCSDQYICFLKAYYFILYTCITIGYGDVVPIIFREKVLLIFIMIFGVLMFSYCVAVFSNYLQERFLEKDDLEKKQHILNQIKKRLHTTDEEDDIIRRVRTYILRQNRIDLENQKNFELIQYLPENIQRQISKNFNEKVLGSLMFFKQFELVKLIDIIKYMRELNFQKGEIVVEEGTLSQDVYFVKHGKAGAMISSRYMFEHKFGFLVFQEQSSFGQYQVFPHSQHRLFSVVALEFCRMFTISGYVLTTYFQKSVEEQKKLERYVAKKKKLLMDTQKLIAQKYRKIYQKNKKVKAPEIVNIQDQYEGVSNQSIANISVEQEQEPISRAQIIKFEELLSNIHLNHQGLLKKLQSKSITPQISPHKRISSQKKVTFNLNDP